MVGLRLLHELVVPLRCQTVCTSNYAEAFDRDWWSKHCPLLACTLKVTMSATSSNRNERFKSSEPADTLNLAQPNPFNPGMAGPLTDDLLRRMEDRFCYYEPVMTKGITDDDHGGTMTSVFVLGTHAAFRWCALRCSWGNHALCAEDA
jgi:hypothetical protein